MDKYKEDYKKSIDSLCGKNLTLTADDILGAAGRGASVTDIPSAKSRAVPLQRYIGVAAACILTVGVIGVVAGASGYGPLASLFSNKAAVETDDPALAHVDAISAELASQGYLLEVDETQSAAGFDVTFAGVTGDWTDAQMLFAIRCSDEGYAAEHDRLYVTVYRGFSEEAYARRVDTAEAFDEAFYDNIEDYILFDNAVAYRSEEDPQLYILSYGAYEYYMEPGAALVTEVRSIRESADTCIEPGCEEIMLHCAFRYTLPEDESALAEVFDIGYGFDEAPVFTESNGVTYHVTEITFSEYDTELICEFYYDGTDLSYIDEDFWGNYDAAGSAHQAVSSGLRLVVDGVEYEPTDLGGVYAEPSGLRRGLTVFPEIDFANATSVLITYNGTEITVK